MDFAYTPEQEALRREVRAFIAEHVTEDVIAELGQSESNMGPGSGPGATGVMSDLYQKIHDRGWLGITYPKEYGGHSGSRMTQYIVEEEFTRVDIRSALAAAGRRRSWRPARTSRSSISSRA